MEFSVGREPHACSEGGGCFGLYKSTIDIIKEDVILVAVGAGKSLSAAGLIQGGVVIGQHLVANWVITKNSTGMNKISMGTLQLVGGLGKGGIGMTQGRNPFTPL